MSANKHDSALYKVVVGHYFVAAIFFLVLTILFTCSLEGLSGHYFQPKLLAITHAAALGWGTMIIFGALYQLLPVILERDLFSLKLCWFSFYLFVPSVILLVYSFWVFDPGITMRVSAILIFIAVLAFSANVFLTVQHKKEESIFQEFILTSCLWLVFTVLLGVLMVFNFSYTFLPKDHLLFLRLHAHMGIAGWFLLLVIGVSSKLVPMFLVSKYQSTGLLSIAYYLINAALLLFLVDGYFFGINARTYIIFCTALTGMVTYCFYIIKCFKSRLRKEVDLPMLQTLLSFLLLAACVSVLPFILHYHLKNDSNAINLSIFYGILIFMGWITALILGQTFKTLPFIVWVKNYGHLVGKVKTPQPADLINSTLLRIQFVGFVVFLSSFFVGALNGSIMLMFIGAISLMITAAVYCTQVISLLLHKTKTEAYDHV